MPTLYPFQRRNVDRILTLPAPRLLWVLDETGLGKSVTAIVAARELGAQRVLIVTKGMVRPEWLARFREWWPEADVGAITMGKDRQGLSAPAKARLEAAYAAPVQIVSYDLLPQINPWAWDLIVVDEIHELVSYRSLVSKTLRNIFRCSPAATKLGLTATLLSAEPKHTWNVLQMWRPDQWGTPLPSGDPPWAFQARYCERYENEYGVVYKGLNPAHAEEFAAKLRGISERTLRSEVADLLPPIDCAPLLVEAGNRNCDTDVALDWLATAAAESTHVSIFTYYRQTADTLITRLSELPRYHSHELARITGQHPPEQRRRILTRLQESPRAVLVGTMDSLGTGISLTAFRQYLIIEPPPTANKIVQALGRFSRLDSQEPSRGFVLLREGRDDDTIMTLRRRLADFNRLIRAGQSESVLSDLLAQPMQGDAFDRRLDDLILTFRGAGAIPDDEDDAA